MAVKAGKAHKAIKYRIYPTQEQAVLLAKTFGCVRFVYNKCIDEHKRRHDSGEKFASKKGMNDFCNHTLKADFPFLREVDKFALTNAVFHLDAAYQRLFSHQGGYPRYKAKYKSKASYTTNFTNNNIKLLPGIIQLPKVGYVTATLHRLPPKDWVLKSATVSMTSSGKYFCSVLFAFDAEVTNVEHPENNAVGLDYKSNGLFVSSEGDCCGMPHYFREGQAKLARQQRKLRHKNKGSKNWRKQQRKIARCHERVANQRRDYLHKKSAEIANQYDLVCVENLNMVEIAHLHPYKNYRKATYDNGYGMFVTMLGYKLHDRGKVLVKVDKNYPSSKTCSACGHVLSELDDSIRHWTCPVCRTMHDRDVNAAINIKGEGVRELLAS